MKCVAVFPVVVKSTKKKDMCQLRVRKLVMFDVVTDCAYLLCCEPATRHVNERTNEPQWTSTAPPSSASSHQPTNDTHFCRIWH